MNDPILRLPAAFGKTVRQQRIGRKLTQEVFSRAAELTEFAVENIELGRRQPTLREIFTIAEALRTKPAMLLADVTHEWHRDPSDIGYYKTRPSDIAWLYTLGYHKDYGDFRELPKVYGSVDQAKDSARTLNVTRKSKGLPLIDNVLTYVKLDNVFFHGEEQK